jgi:Fic family protein
MRRLSRHSPHISRDYEGIIRYIRRMSEIWQSPHWPTLWYDSAVVEPYLAQAMESLGEIGGLQEGLAPEDRTAMRLNQIVQEVVASFGIEGVALNPAEIEASVVASMTVREAGLPARRSDAIAQLMRAAREGRTPMTADRLAQWHRLLFAGIEVEDLGQWRRHDIEIVRSATAGAGQSDVLFRAPPPERLATEMAQFLGWLNAPATTVLPVRAALAHLWFETIHPFSDGNGRIGRALIEHVFAQHSALPFSLSRQIEREKKAYYAALQAGRRAGAGHIDATAFVLWFLQCLIRAAALARDEIGFLLRRSHYLTRWRDMLDRRQIKVLETLFTQGAARVAQGITAQTYAKIANVSPATATRDLGAMEAAGALQRSAEGGRSTRYYLAV